MHREHDACIPQDSRGSYSNAPRVASTLGLQLFVCAIWVDLWRTEAWVLSGCCLGAACLGRYSVAAFDPVTRANVDAGPAYLGWDVPSFLHPAMTVYMARQQQYPPSLSSTTPSK